MDVLVTPVRWLGRGLAAALWLSLTSVGCSHTAPPPADVVATFSGGYVTRAEVERELGVASPRSESSLERREGMARRIAWRKLLVVTERAQLEGLRSFQLALHQAERQFVVQAFMEALAKSVEVPAAEVDAEVERQRGLAAGRQETLLVRHIFLRADSSMSQAERDAQRGLAEKLLARLRTGESFEQLAREYSQSETARGGGLIRGLRRGVSDASFEQAAFALEKGQISDVVTTPRGYHIIKLEERALPRPFVEAEVRAAVERQLKQRALEQQRADLVAQLKSATSSTVGWDDEGQLHPDADGVVLRVGDLVLTAGDLDLLERQFSGVGLAHRTPAQRLTDMLDNELLYHEALRRGVVSSGELAQQRARLAEEVLEETAEQREVERLQAAVSREDVARFAVEEPDLTKVPGEVRAQVLVVPFEIGKGYDAYVRALELAQRARLGEDFGELVRRYSQGPNVDQGGDSGLVPPERLAALGGDLAQATIQLEVGGITDPVRIPPTRLGPLGGQYEGAFAIARLVEHRPDRQLDPATEEAELFRRYWEAHGQAIVDRQVDAALARAGFKLLEPR